VEILHVYSNNNYYYYYYCSFMALWILSRTTRVSRHQRGKTNLDLLEQDGMLAWLCVWIKVQICVWPI